MTFDSLIQPASPLSSLPREDQELIVQLVLHSGSLKDLASAYSVSYPTIRQRLDRVIERLRAIVEGRPRSPMSELVADLVERGDLSPGAGRRLLEVHESVVARGRAGPQEPAGLNGGAA